MQPRCAPPQTVPTDRAGDVLGEPVTEDVVDHGCYIGDVLDGPEAQDDRFCFGLILGRRRAAQAYRIFLIELRFDRRDERIELIVCLPPQLLVHPVGLVVAYGPVKAHDCTLRPADRARPELTWHGWSAQQQISARPVMP
jgi:hypothetical protein